MDSTYLYIKQHEITGLLYFGKTTSDPHTYYGSGKYWSNHIKKHGKEHVLTKWVSEPFTDKEDLVEFATFFSEEFNIVECKNWANLIFENGLDGFPVGTKHTHQTKIKMSNVQRGRIISETHKEKLSIAAKNRSKEVRDKVASSLRGRKQSEETIQKKIQSNSKPRGPYGKSEHCKNRPILTCPHCHKNGKGGSMMRYHFNNCKFMNKGN